MSGPAARLRRQPVPPQSRPDSCGPRARLGPTTPVKPNPCCGRRPGASHRAARRTPRPARRERVGCSSRRTPASRRAGPQRASSRDQLTTSLETRAPPAAPASTAHSTTTARPATLAASLSARRPPPADPSPLRRARGHGITPCSTSRSRSIPRHRANLSVCAAR